MPDYVASAVIGYLVRLRARGVASSRPIRIDGLVDAEIRDGLQKMEEAVAPGRLRILSTKNNEGDLLVNAERATRYRNEVDAGPEGSGFVLLVPQGQNVESSLEEPAFLVVPRAAIFMQALSALRLTLGLSPADIEGLRELAAFRHAESLYAFLTQWDVNSGTVARWASHEHLGLLGDSLLAGPDTTTLRNRLVPNAKAIDLLSRPGQSPRRVLEDLANQVGLSLEDGAPEVLSLLDWLRSGKAGPRPKALDFATWRVEKWTDPILRWNPDLSQPPHRGWADDDGRIKADIPAGGATLQWTVIRSDSDTAFEIQLIDDGSQQVVRKIGRTRRPKKSLRWTSIVTDAVRAELRELNPSGDVEGYALRLRVDVFQGKRWVQDLRSEPFFLYLPDAGD